MWCRGELNICERVMGWVACESKATHSSMPRNGLPKVELVYTFLFTFFFFLRLLADSVRRIIVSLQFADCKFSSFYSSVIWFLKRHYTTQVCKWREWCFESHIRFIKYPQHSGIMIWAYLYWIHFSWRITIRMIRYYNIVSQRTYCRNLYLVSFCLLLN